MGEKLQVRRGRIALLAAIGAFGPAVIAPSAASAEVTMTVTCRALGDGTAVINGTVSGGGSGTFGAAKAIVGPQPFPWFGGSGVFRVAQAEFSDGVPFETTTFGPPNDSFVPPVLAGDVLRIQAVGGSGVIAEGTVTCVELEKTVTDLLGELAAAGVLSQGQANSLLVKVDAASASAERGNETAAINQLEALKNQIAGMHAAGRLTAEQHDDLIAAVNREIAGLTGG